MYVTQCNPVDIYHFELVLPSLGRVKRLAVNRNMKLQTAKHVNTRKYGVILEKNLIAVIVVIFRFTNSLPFHCRSDKN